MRRGEVYLFQRHALILLGGAIWEKAQLYPERAAKDEAPCYLSVHVISRAHVVVWRGRRLVRVEKGRLGRVQKIMEGHAAFYRKYCQKKSR